jgi:hypothetical protein
MGVGGGHAGKVREPVGAVVREGQRCDMTSPFPRQFYNLLLLTSCLFELNVEVLCFLLTRDFMTYMIPPTHTTCSRP